MIIDNTIFSMYSRCGQLYFERYESYYESLHMQLASHLPEVRTEAEGPRGIELDEPSEGRDFGTRFHQLLHLRRLSLLQPSGDGNSEVRVEPVAFREWPDEAIESECQSTLAAYEAHYIRDFDYLESERTHLLPLPVKCPRCWIDGHPTGEGQFVCPRCGTAFAQHQLAVKLDAVVRFPDGTIGPLDTKTESRPGYNTREDWAGKTQAKIYLHALSTLYPLERVSRLVVDVVTRGSAKAKRPPIFYRHDDIVSSPQAIDEALHNLVYVAHEIEHNRATGWWPSNMNVCKRGWERCPYYPLHVLGKTDANLRLYKIAENYLEL